MIGADSPSIPRRAGDARDLARDPGVHGAPLPLRSDPASSLVLHESARRRPGAVADENLAGLGGLLKPSGDVDHVAAHHQLAAGCGLAARHHVARVDADPQAHLGVVPVGDPRGEAREVVADSEGCQHGPLGVVLVRLRDSEHRQDGVAHEFLGHAAEALDVTVDEGEQLTLHLANLLRIEALP